MLTLPNESKTVLALSAPFRSGGAAAELPQRVRILAWGENLGRTTGARILVDDKATALSSNQELVAVDRVPMDYEHQSHKGHPNYLPDPRQSPGFGKIEVVPGDGVYLSAIEYTPNGLSHAASYQDVSAVVHLDDAGRPLWVSSVALTQTGDVSGMEFSEAVAALSARINSPDPKSNQTSQKTTMDTNNVFRDLLVKFLGLGAEATDEEITAAASKKADGPAAEATQTEALSAVLDRLTTLEARNADAERDALVARATREGKVIPLSAELIKATSVAVLTGMVDGLPAGEVPLATQGKRELPGTNVVALSADEASAARALGLTEEEYRKAKA